MSVLAPIQNCEFKYQCPKDWFELEESDDENIRYCNKCDQNVYFCKDEKELKQSIEKNRCVAIVSINNGEDSMMLGMITEERYKNITDK
ncbi:hypothetical protein MNBD_GAMMA23-2547 [hydrothermal vent metagenome]|uniref:Uncharacterized protein n=1 Tax=hydrothermal vent metagenome TaxID=652676 RepID=A0A3B1A3V2_9ZZZZ